MKSIEIDDDLYVFIAGQTKHIGESASDILRRLLMPESPAPHKVASQDAVSDEAVAVSVDSATTEAGNIDAPAAVQPVSQQSLLERVTDANLAAYTKRVEQFLFILASLHQVDADAFAKVTQIKGKNRVYFATSKDALLETGSSTNPKAIPDSPYWVVTNNNTGKKVAMLEQVLQVLGYDEGVAQTVVARFAPETQTNGQ